MNYVPEIVNFKKKTKLGLYCTDYDIKDQQRIFKANQSKTNYVEKLGNQNVKNLDKRNFKSHFGRLEHGIFYNPRSAIDGVRIQRPTMTSLYKDYMAEAQKIVGYINIARNLNISKAKLKRIKKIRGEIDRKKLIMIKPLAERINILYQSLTKGHVNENKFKEINLIQNNHSNLPFINVV